MIEITSEINFESFFIHLVNRKKSEVKFKHSI